MAEMNWLSVLENATDYRELQNAFAQMAEAALSTNDSEGLAASIDEAIRRIEAERVRDSAELDKFNAEYDEFKSQQSGVVGWFKRKMPFTETRKQELEHRGSVEDQKAEILADNFVIARAQMLKEKLLAPQTRKLGRLPEQWRSELMKHDSLKAIQAYGACLIELGREVPSGRAFIDTVGEDIQAFGAANFSDKQERILRDADLRGAQSELKCLENEIHDKEALRRTALERLTQLIHEDLESHDPAFKTVVNQKDQLGKFYQHFDGLLKLTRNYFATLESHCKQLSDLNSLPEKKQTIESRLSKHQQELIDGESRLNVATQALREPTARCETLNADVVRGKASLDAAQRMYDAYIAEQSKAEVTSNADFNGDSPVVAEYERLKSALAQSEANLKQATPELERAKRLFQQASQEVAGTQKKMSDVENELSEASDSERRLRQIVSAGRDELNRQETQMHSELRQHSQRQQSLTWLRNFQSLSPVSMDLLAGSNATSRDILPSTPAWNRSVSDQPGLQEIANWKNTLEKLTVLLKGLQSDQATIAENLKDLKKAKIDSLRKRGKLLLESSLVDELKFE